MRCSTSSDGYEADAPTISMDNTLHGFSRLPLTLRV